ncbi:Rv1733c family protein [Streptomyces yanii]|uniref:Rv1733c family protein n=1 Tax=Streptomyces yanii TaxID=78510 RepID=UPI00336F01E5
MFQADSPGSEPMWPGKRHRSRIRRPFERRRNPLQRTADRVRSRWLAASVVFALVAVFCGVAVGIKVWDADSVTAQHEARHRHQVTATTVSKAEGRLPARFAGASEATARAFWEYPASVPHTDTIAVTPNTPVGRTVTLWVDDSGRMSTAPHSRGDRALQAAAAGACAMGVVALSAGLVVRLRLRRVETRSLAHWDEEWERVEPRWSGRLRRDSGADDD